MEENQSLTRALQLVERMERSGALETFVELAEMAHAAKATLGDGMVHRLADRAAVALEMIDPLLDREMAGRMARVTGALSEARAVAAKDQTRISVFDLLRAFREPEVQFALRWLLATARRMPKALE